MSSKEKILQSLESFLSLGIKDFLLVSNAPDGIWIHGAPRILIIASGNVKIKFFHDRKLESRIFVPGSGFYCGKNGYLFSSYIEPAECISLTFYANYIRAVYVHFDGKRKPPTELDTFHHTELPLSETGNMLISLLDNMAADNTYNRITPRILEALLMISIEEIKRQESGRLNPSSRIWKELDHYIRTNPDKTVSRSSLAKHFHISPGYISHLFKKFTGEDLMTMIISYKLEYASRLLLETDIPVREISDKCGFNYTSYFIRRFKKHYGVTPHVFRNANIRKT